MNCYDEDHTTIQYIGEPVTLRFVGFSAGTNPDVARAAFLARYGVKPQATIVNGGAVLVGPVPEQMV